MTEQRPIVYFTSIIKYILLNIVICLSLAFITEAPDGIESSDLHGVDPEYIFFIAILFTVMHHCTLCVYDYHHSGDSTRVLHSVRLCDA